MQRWRISVGLSAALVGSAVLLAGSRLEYLAPFWPLILADYGLAVAFHSWHWRWPPSWPPSTPSRAPQGSQTSVSVSISPNAPSAAERAIRISQTRLGGMPRGLELRAGRGPA